MTAAPLVLFAFLRAINVGRGRTVKMDGLRGVLERLGLARVETFLASGNVAFEAGDANIASLEQTIGAALRREFGFDIDTYIRTAAELAAIDRFEAFPKARREAAAEVNVIFLKDRLPAGLAQKVNGLSSETDEFRAHGREIFWLRRQKAPGLYSTVALEKTLTRPFTVRRLETVREMVRKRTPPGRVARPGEPAR